MGLRDASWGQSDRPKVLMLLQAGAGGALSSHTLGPRQVCTWSSLYSAWPLVI